MSRPRAIEDLLRDAAPQVLAAVARWFGAFAGSEDAVHEAILAAEQRRPTRERPRTRSAG